MTAAFTWTERRTARLIELTREGRSPAAIAALIGEKCEAEHVLIRQRELRMLEVRAPLAPALATVPRPPRPTRPGLIDLSRAPSSMEQRHGKGRSRC